MKILEKAITQDPKPSNFLRPPFSLKNDNEKRKLAEQRATRKLKSDTSYKEPKGKIGSKKRELKLTVSKSFK